MDVERLLVDLVSNSTLLSFRVAGEELVIDFSGSQLEGAYGFSVDTDAWVFVEKESVDIDYSVIGDENFFVYRREILPRLFDLTGYDVESAAIINGRFLRLTVHGQAIVVCPVDRKVQQELYKQSWGVITEHEGDETYFLMGFRGGELVLNGLHPSLIK